MLDSASSNSFGSTYVDVQREAVVLVVIGGDEVVGRLLVVEVCNGPN